MSSGGGSAISNTTVPAKKMRLETAGNVVLILKDGETLTTHTDIIMKSDVLANAVGAKQNEEDVGSGSEEEDEDSRIEIPLPTVTKAVMEKIVAYLDHHRVAPFTEVPKPLHSKNINDIVADEFDRKMIQQPKDQEIQDFLKDICDLLSAAEYLSIPSLIVLCMVPFAVRIKGAGPEKIMENLGLDPQKKLTEEEEERIRAKYPWLETEL